MTKSPDPIDKLVGRNIRIFRVAKGVTQTQLANAVDVTFQQIQKYERGTNRVGSGRLSKIAKTLEVPVAHFFQNRTTDAHGADYHDEISELLALPYSLRVLKALSKISDKETIRCLVDLTESVAKRD